VNNHGQLGFIDEYSRKRFAKISFPDNKKIVAIAAAGAFHTLALGGDGQVYAAGQNRNDQLGWDDNANRKTFDPVSSLAGKNIISIADRMDDLQERYDII
jgi:alpha-tubulin suppressor-like RCC1 family protein